jgi:peptidoglycan/LPS O-acetylase OafA/YrhL
LCIEEQFYLLWPCVVFWIKERRRLMYLCVACIVACPVARILRWLGRISYGAYVFHDIFHSMFRRFARHYFVHWRLGTALIAFAFTLLMSWASYRWYESRFIRMKERWAR